MPTDLVFSVSSTRDENPAFRMLRDFRSVLEHGSHAGIAVFVGIGLFASLIAAICGVEGVWF